MVSISTVSAGQAESYYQKDNYYAKVEGQWQGLGAEKLGLSGEIKKEDFVNVVYGKAPDGSFTIQGGGQNHEHRAGVDITFSAPKSASILSEVLGDTKVREAHEKAVEKALEYIEKNFSQARQTENGITEKVNTGNLVIAKFHHTTSRELDPHLHTHAVIMNMTQRADGQWRAMSNEEMYNRKMLSGLVYRNEYMANLKEHGHSIQSDEKGLFEIRGVDRESIEQFSKRSEQIDSKVKELRESGKYANANEQQLREYAALGSRAAKGDVNMETVRDSWREQLGKERIESIQKNVEAEKEQKQTKPKINEYETVRLACRIQTEQESTFSKGDILKTMLKLSAGEHRIDALKRAFDKLESKNEIKTLDAEKGIYTTSEMQKIEKSIAEKAEKGQDSMGSVMTKEQAQQGIKDFEKEKSITMTAGQKDAVEHILTSKDRYVGIQGDAGTGKTTMLSAVREGLEREGYTVHGLSFTGKAALEVEQQAGIKSQTVDRFLAQRSEEKIQKLEEAREGLHRSTEAYMLGGKHFNMAAHSEKLHKVYGQIDAIEKRNQVWVVDEVSMLGSRKMDDLMKAAEKVDARVVFVGDTKQLQSISAGRMFSKLQEGGGMETVRMADVQRQKDASYLETVKDFSEKKIDSAFQKLETKGRITEIGGREDRLEAIVKDYTAKDPKDCIIVTARNMDRNELNSAIRGELKDQNKLSRQEYTFTVRESKGLSPIEKHFGQSYKEGDRVIANTAGIMGRAGAEGKVIDIDTANHRIKVQIDIVVGKDLELKVRGGRIVDTPTEGGKTYTIDLKSQGQNLSVYSEKQQAFSQGDKVVFLKNDRSLNVKNGQIGEVKSIGANGKMTVQMEDGKEKKINLNTQYNYVGHGYAITDFKAQGQTAKEVIYHADTKTAGRKQDAEDKQQKGGVNFNQAYVAITRGKEDVRIYTDSKENLKEQMKDEQKKTSTLDYEKSEKASEVSSSEISKTEERGQKTEDRGNGKGEKMESEKGEKMETANREMSL